MDLLLRLGLAALIAGSLYFVYKLVNVVLLRIGASSRLPQGFLPGRPALLYFSSPDCAPCTSIQSPIVEKLSLARSEEIQVHVIDTSVDVELAKRWHILSLPSTIVVDARGKPRSINHGVVSLKTLEKQLELSL